MLNEANLKSLAQGKGQGAFYPQQVDSARQLNLETPGRQEAAAAQANNFF